MMEMNDISNMVNENCKSIVKIDQWALGVETRLSNIEAGNQLLTNIQVTLKELTMESRYFGEKLDELKKSVDRNNTDNAIQHKELIKRVDDIEAKPGISWDKAKWIIISGILSAALAFIISKILIK